MSKRMNSKVQCLICGRILESMHRHDYVTCGCPNNTMVDGGNDYLRYGGKDYAKNVRVLQDPDRGIVNNPYVPQDIDF